MNLLRLSIGERPQQKKQVPIPDRRPRERVEKERLKAAASPPIRL